MVLLKRAPQALEFVDSLSTSAGDCQVLIYAVMLWAEDASSVRRVRAVRKGSMWRRGATSYLDREKGVAGRSCGSPSSSMYTNSL